MKNQRSIRAMYLTLGFCMLIAGCDPNSTGSKDTQQLDNDNDPTKVEDPGVTDDMSSGELERRERAEELVLVTDFEDSDWQGIKEELKLESVEDSIRDSFGSGNVGADAWRSRDNYEYRLIYYSEDGYLKTKPQLRSKQGQKSSIAINSLDSLAMEDLWEEIERNTSRISDYQR
ncbi:hypothetical protein [Algoriphagus terrigena]|uniref:hypothetical protein n=1 Tax=Algoriphagus terrigena TaxID=344884 RepID=UPI0003F9ACB4|nr:hypothetical protein [Algoriphagus terrigena]